MKKQTAVILLLLPLSLFSQQKSNSSFEANAGFIAAAYDVVWTMPKDMVDLDTTVVMQIRRAYRSVSFYRPVLESKNQEFILMYNKRLLFSTDCEIKFLELAATTTFTDKPLTTNNWPRNFISHNVKLAHGYMKNHKFLKFPPHMYKAEELKKPYNYGKKAVEFRFEDYVTLFPKGRARRWFNADTVFMYTLPVDDPFKEGYTHCTGIVITKKDRAGIELKLYFTDEGKRKESKYLRSLRKKIWYRNDAWKYDADVFNRADQTYFKKDAVEE